MSQTGFFSSYFRSLLWICAFFAAGVYMMLVVNTVSTDFLFGNPNGTRPETIQTILFMPPLLGLIAAIGAFLVFAVPQAFQAIISLGFSNYPRLHFGAAVVAFVPITTAVTWYCWEYLTPTDFNLGINEGADWSPYQHGITQARYLAALAFQIPETLFSIAYYCKASFKRKLRQIGLIGLMLAVACGGIAGYYSAARSTQEYRLSSYKSFLGHEDHRSVFHSTAVF